MTKMMINEALTQALHEEMTRDERVFVMGEDCRISMMGRTTGLLDAFGPARVRNTPISEAGIVGAAIGAAASGMVPVVDLMMINFALRLRRPDPQQRGEAAVHDGRLVAVPAHDRRLDGRRRRARGAALGLVLRADHQRRRDQGRAADDGGGREGDVQVGDPRSRTRCSSSCR